MIGMGWCAGTGRIRQCWRRAIPLAALFGSLGCSVQPRAGLAIDPREEGVRLVGYVDSEADVVTVGVYRRGGSATELVAMSTVPLHAGKFAVPGIVLPRDEVVLVRAEGIGFRWAAVSHARMVRLGSVVLPKLNRESTVESHFASLVGLQSLDLVQLVLLRRWVTPALADQIYEDPTLLRGGRALFRAAFRSWLAAWEKTDELNPREKQAGLDQLVVTQIREDRLRGVAAPVGELSAAKLPVYIEVENAMIGALVQDADDLHDQRARREWLRLLAAWQSDGERLPREVLSDSAQPAVCARNGCTTVRQLVKASD